MSLKTHLFCRCCYMELLYIKEFYCWENFKKKESARDYRLQKDLSIENMKWQTYAHALVYISKIHAFIQFISYKPFSGHKYIPIFYHTRKLEFALYFFIKKVTIVLNFELSLLISSFLTFPERAISDIFQQNDHERSERPKLPQAALCNLHQQRHFGDRSSFLFLTLSKL
ncbi:hypothetical protein EGR_05285 [Echinococcus granulosus]|uniref:Uncharacterized protein n=1 Tax=Echinococcus granulosus TaxID=6210 RepID=W6V1Q1_ECHGR|nr:hypothetical protein EGR_05285 [Echinococcus granulosus]EUB59809.1 hypothetical protein EGR_05285 [Echinococcus granulosus]